MDNEQAPSSMGRRDILKKSAVVAAAAWTAPMIVSSKVGASSGGTCPEVPCSNVYVFKVEGDNACATFQTTPCASTIQNSSALTVLQACVPGATGSYHEGSGGSVTLPKGYDVINVIGKKYPSGCFPGIGGTPTLDGQCGQTVSLPAGYSHMYVVVCTEANLGESPVVADTATDEKVISSTQETTTTTQAATTTSEATTTTSSEPPPTTSEAATTTSTEAPPTTEATTTTTTQPPPTTEAITTTSEATTTTAAVPEP